MAIERKKLEKIYMIVTIVIILLVILGVVLYIIKPEQIDERNINLEDNNFIEEKLKESEYDIFHIEMKYVAKSAKVNFYGYETEYVSIETGKDNEISYKNAIKSKILKNVEKSSVGDIEESINKYKEKALEYLEYTRIDLVSEFDRTKDDKEVNTNNTLYENMKEGNTIHYIVLFEERINYEISFYVEGNNLIGEISYYIPSPEIPEDNNVDNDQNQTNDKVGVG